MNVTVNAVTAIVDLLERDAQPYIDTPLSHCIGEHFVQGRTSQAEIGRQVGTGDGYTMNIREQVSLQVAELESLIGKARLHTLFGHTEGGHGAQCISLHHNTHVIDRPLLVDFGQVDLDPAFAQRQGRRQATDAATDNEYLSHVFSPINRAALPPRMSARSDSLNPGTPLTNSCTSYEPISNG